MSIARLTICEWIADRHRDTNIDEPAWSDIEAAVRALNNSNLNDVYLTPDRSKPETYLCIGGGGGRYIVTGSVENEVFPTLIDRTRAETPKILLTVGGQVGDYPGNWIVDLATVLTAARAFFEAGG